MTPEQRARELRRIAEKLETLAHQIEHGPKEEGAVQKVLIKIYAASIELRAAGDA
jgi:ribosomal protein L17